MAFYFGSELTESGVKIGFFDTSIFPAEKLPANAVELTAEEYAELMAAQCAGKQIEIDANGKPYAVAQGCKKCDSIKHEIKKASKTELGHVKIGENLIIDEDGAINAPATTIYKFYDLAEENWVENENYFSVNLSELDEIGKPEFIKDVQIFKPLSDDTFSQVWNTNKVLSISESGVKFISQITAAEKITGKICLVYVNAGEMAGSSWGGDNKILVSETDSSADYLLNKLVSANKNTLSITEVKDTEGKSKIQLDVISDVTENPLIQLNNFPNSTLPFSGSAWGSGKNVDWGGSYQNTQCYCWKSQAKAAGTLNRVTLCLCGSNTIQSYAALRIGVFNSEGVLLGATKFFRRDELDAMAENYLPGYGEQSFELIPEAGQSLHIEQGEYYYIQIIARGIVIASQKTEDQNLYSFMLDYKFSRCILSLNGAHWVDPINGTGWQASYNLMYGSLFQGG